MLPAAAQDYDDAACSKGSESGPSQFYTLGACNSEAPESFMITCMPVAGSRNASATQAVYGTSDCTGPVVSNFTDVFVNGGCNVVPPQSQTVLCQ